MESEVSEWLFTNDTSSRDGDICLWQDVIHADVVCKLLNVIEVVAAASTASGWITAASAAAGIHAIVLEHEAIHDHGRVKHLLAG